MKTEFLNLLVYHTYETHAYDEEPAIVPIAASKDKELLNSIKENINTIAASKGINAILQYLVEIGSGPDLSLSYFTEFEKMSDYFEGDDDHTQSLISLLENTFWVTTKDKDRHLYGHFKIVQIPVVSEG